MLLLQEISACRLLPLALLLGMGAQLLGLFRHSRVLILCGALISGLAALAERDAAFLAAQGLILWLFLRQGRRR